MFLFYLLESRKFSHECLTVMTRCIKNKPQSPITLFNPVTRTNIFGNKLLLGFFSEAIAQLSNPLQCAIEAIVTQEIDYLIKWMNVFGNKWICLVKQLSFRSHCKVVKSIAMRDWSHCDVKIFYLIKWTNVLGNKRICLLK